ncbi:MAG TPA: hypothetical protein VIK58_20990 [Caldimonas sp.]
MKIFDVIDKLIAAIPLTPEKVGKILDTRVARDKDSDTSAIAAYAQPETVKGGPYESVDLRMPDDDIGEGGVFLSVTMRADGGIDQAAISERYGTDFHAEIPSPRYKPGTVPVYLTYERDWGSLAFGVTADAEGKLVRFILNTRAEPAAADDEA